MPDSTAPLADYSEPERAIFDAALRIFARDGRRGARMQVIADAADINKAMLHYYFRDKESLYDEVFSFTMGRFMASFDTSLREASTFAETLRAFIEEYVEFVRSNEDAMRLMVNENLTGGTRVGKYLREWKQSGDAPPQILAEQLERAAEAGTIRDVDPHHTVVSVVSTCLFFFVAKPTVQMMHPDASDDWSAFVEARKDHLFDLMYRGLARRD